MFSSLNLLSKYLSKFSAVKITVDFAMRLPKGTTLKVKDHD
ncbi:hypothetical protein PCIT_b0460 [Pseudoalteromonas citrea]|uniref:Uncharacterized protein n=1 Tax=Pseudoalteromonas citrea TaxID=43655 RepID=A0AAD4AEH2_9GAMM|nr:hypothetical protein PCIT_b0460 [Pseudoalteromonas citrea]